jgi:hypothetical protein
LSDLFLSQCVWEDSPVKAVLLLYAVVCISQCENAYAAVTTLLYRRGAACKGSAGGEDIVNEQDVFAFEP